MRSARFRASNRTVNMAKGAHLKFHSHSATNRPIPPATRSVTHAVTRSGGAIAETRTAIGANRLKPSSARLKSISAKFLPLSATKLLEQPPSGALAPEPIRDRANGPPFGPKAYARELGTAAH